MDYASMAAVWAAAAVLIEEDEKEEMIRSQLKRNVSCWVKDWVKKREEEGFYSKLMKELQENEPKLYQNFLRMSSNDFDHLTGLITPIVQKRDTQMRKSIPVGERLAVTLRFLATGDSFMSLQYLFRIPQCTISKIIPEVCEAIYSVLKREYLKVPSNEQEWKKIANRFNEQWNFPNCIGAVDGKHVVMTAPPNSGSIYYNYKGTHSIVLMGIADADYKLSYIDVGCNGRVSDGGVFKNCSFSHAMEEGRLNLPEPEPLPDREMNIPFVLVADDAFAMKKNLLKPYAGKNLIGLQRIFNYRLSRARRIIENVFGIISARFRVLRTPINLDANKTRKITLACCALHNYLMIRNTRIYAPNGTFDRIETDGTIVPGDWRNESPNGTMYPIQNETNYIGDDAKKIRDEFQEYFVNEGEVEWQYKQI